MSLAVTFGLAGTAAAKPKTCDSEDVAAAKAAIEAACPCDGQTAEDGTITAWKNHGKYVSCVAKARKSATQGLGVPKQCLNDVQACAANSACGKASDAVACVVTTGVCLDDLTPGDSVPEGTCDESGAACDTNDDCAQSSCQVASSSQACTDIGGVAAGVECCQ